MSRIHPTALIDPKAHLEKGVYVGAYSIIGPEVILEEDVRVWEHVIIQGKSHIEKACEIFPFVSIGLASQDKKSPKGTQSKVHIGHNTIIREHTSIHAATLEADVTRIGNHCLIMGQAHIAHDCLIGNHVVISQGAVLGGHVFIDDCSTIGGVSAIHQYVRVGKYAMLGGKSALVQDLPPFFSAVGMPATFHKINDTGLVRNGFTQEQITQIEETTRVFLKQDLTLPEMQKMLAKKPDFAARELLNFIERSTRGLASPKKSHTGFQNLTQPPVLDFTKSSTASSNVSLE